MNDMNERGRLPEASDAFAQAILQGSERIRRHERRRRLSRIAAAFAVVAVGLGAALARLNAPRPDAAVTPVNPEAVVSVAEEKAQTAPEPEKAEAEGKQAQAEAEQAQTGLEPEEAAPSPAMVQIPEESGYSYVLNVAFNQDGPFEAGEWAVVCGESGGIDNGNRTVWFYEQPDEASNRAEMVQGMRAQYLADAENGFARVRFEGMEGYVEKAHLAHGGSVPEMDGSKHLELSFATLALTDSHGSVREQQILHRRELGAYALLKLLEGLEPADPAEYENAPFGAMLRVTLWDPDHPEYDENGWLRMTERFLSIPRDGAFVVMAEDGTIYSGEKDASFFWTVFPEIWAATWSDGEVGD